MVTAFKILTAKELADSVYLELTPTGIEERGAGVVVFDSDAIPNYQVMMQGGGRTKLVDDKRPIVIANGQEMRLQLFQVMPVYTPYTANTMLWSTKTKKRALGGWTLSWGGVELRGNPAISMVLDWI